MIVHLKSDSGREEREAFLRGQDRAGLSIHASPDPRSGIVAIIGDETRIARLELERHPSVERTEALDAPFTLAHREFLPGGSTIRVGPVVFGGEEVPVIAGPCAVEERESLLSLAKMLKDAGATVLRGGAFKPRTSPHSFQGLCEEGLAFLAEAREETGLLVVTEVMDTRDVDLVCRYTDIVQIGARNIQNFSLLKEVGLAGKPVLLKRGMMTTVDEYLMSAEHILASGNFNVILCERGIRTFETGTRNTLDLSAVPLIHHRSHLPVIVDPSHATGNWRWVTPMAMAAVAAGADGLMVEVHADPDRAYSDGEQSLLPERFRDLMRALRRIAPAVGRSVAVRERV